MKGQKRNLLSKRAIATFCLLKPDPLVYNVETILDFKKEFPTLFKGLGTLKETYTIPQQEDAVPLCLYTLAEFRSLSSLKLKKNFRGWKTYRLYLP